MLRLSQAKGSQRGGLSPGTLGIGTLVGSQHSALPTRNLASSGRVWDCVWDCVWDPAAAAEGGREAGLPSPATEPALYNLIAKLFLQDASRRARVSHLHGTTRPSSYPLPWQEHFATSIWAVFKKKTNPKVLVGQGAPVTLLVMRTGPDQRLEKHLLDGAGLWLKIGTMVKASARGRFAGWEAARSLQQEPSSGRSTQLPSVCAAATREKMPSQPRRWLLPPYISPRTSAGSWKVLCCRQGYSQLLKT